MVVLSIIGVIIGLILVTLLVKASNEHSSKVYKYKIFNYENFILSILGYFASYFGYEWYLKAIKQNTDILNGELLMVIGVLFFLAAIYANIKNTSLLYGLLMSIVTELVYAAAAPVVFYALIMAIAFFSKTKPVYNIND